MSKDVYIRAYTKPKNESHHNYYKSKQNDHYTRPDRILFFDTETTDDERQSLKFGYFEIYDKEKLEVCGVFCNDKIQQRELEILRIYCNATGIPLMTRKEFVDDVFYPEVFYKETYCVGFNLPFDIGRIAIDYGDAREKSMRKGFSFKLSNNMKYPRVLIKHVSNTISFIKLGRSLDKSRWNFRGNFLDLRTLGWAIRNKKYSLQSACEDFNTPIRKIKVREHGRITKDYIGYCINDVKSTYEVFRAMLMEYEKHDIDLPITKAYSPASIGKALLEKIGIKRASEKIRNIPDSMLGYLMSTYYGGRSEVRIRKKPVPVVDMDFLSMYPTVCTLMELWKFITCDHIKYEECTDEIIELIGKIRLEDLTNQGIWRKLHVIVEVEPHSDILPVRGKYDDDGKSLNIGINYLEGNGMKLWYTIHDVIVSKLLTGKTPTVSKAIRFVPLGIQEGLRPMKFLGRPINPQEDFFKVLIEYRNELKSRMKNITNNLNQYRELDSNQYITKIIANATSYGIFIEVDTVEEESEVEVFGIDNFTTFKNKIEKTGKMFNPIIGVLITGASRLLLGMAEAFVNKNNGYIAFCDTDSIAVNPELADDVQEFFRPLNPYNFKDDLLKIEDDNYKRTKDSSQDYSIDPRKEPLLFYGISAKRYVLYRKDGSRIEIIKNSEHGLGYLQSPFENKDWIVDFWQKALDDYYNNNYFGNNVLYSEYPAVSKQVVSSATIMKGFDKLNENKDYDNKIKPFNFFLVGSGVVNKKTKEPIIPLIPFSKVLNNVTKQPFVDYKTGLIHLGEEYWRNLSEVYTGYFNHKEVKFDNDIGCLQRKSITIKNIIHIGKESSNLELTNIIGIGNDVDNVEEYRQINDLKLKRNSKLRNYIDKQFDIIKNRILDLHQVNLSRFGIHKIMLYRVKKSIKDGTDKGLSKLTKWKFINCYSYLHKPKLNSTEMAVQPLLVKRR